jgi:hypothetical protein
MNIRAFWDIFSEQIRLIIREYLITLSLPESFNSEAQERLRQI